MGNSDSKEIIIKCPLDEMVKQFCPGYVIVWHDPIIDLPENRRFLPQLEKFCEVLTFTEWEKAKEYIETTEAACHVVTSGPNGHLFVSEIAESENISSIYVFCEDKEYHSTWAQNYPKITCIETSLQNLLHQVQENLLGISSLSSTLPAFAPTFNTSDSNNLQRYLQVIPNFKDREQAKQDFLSLSRAICSDKQTAQLLSEFEKNYNVYNKEQILKWYAQESFLYKLTNICLRIATSDSIQYSRLPLKDIEQAIKDQYQAKSKIFNGLLYRGAYLSEEEWSNLKENQGGEIEMHGFLSVSKEKNVALSFMETDPGDKVFITILVPKGPNEEEQGFAEIEEFSDYPNERGVLFNVRSRFTVLEAEDDYEYAENLNCRHLVLLYGAQGFRRYMTEQNPVREVYLENVSQKLVFVSLKSDLSYGQKYLDEEDSPFLCIPPTMNQIGKYSFSGCLLFHHHHEEIPFYGYQCSQCEAKKQKSYFICIDCNGREYCQNCFEQDNFPCSRANHSLVLETKPYTFWCERMSDGELNHLKFQEDLVDKEGDVLQLASMYLQSREYEKAIEHYSLYIQQNEAQGNSDKLASCYSNIGEIYCLQGEYDKAMEYLQKGLELLEDLHGENALAIAAVENNLGSVYHNQGEYDTALEYYFKSLEVRLSANGESDPSIANSYMNIGQIYENQGEYTKALEYYFKSLTILEFIHKGNYDPAVASAFQSIGSAYGHREENKKALEFYEKSLEILKSLYGENDASVGSVYGKIGTLFYSQNEYEQALEYHQKALQISQQIYAEENHATLATDYNNIGQALHSLERYEEALEYYQKSLDIAKSVHGEQHSDVTTTYDNIGLIYYDKGEYQKALEYYFKSLGIFQAIHEGDNHDDVAIAYNSIGATFLMQGEYGRALEYYTKCLEIKKFVYGESHADVAQALTNLGSVYEKQGDVEKALECYLKTVEIERVLYGENHTEVASSFDNIGNIHNQLGNYNTALEYFLQCVKIRISNSGEEQEDSDISSVYDKIAKIYKDHGEYNKALEYALKSLEIVKAVFGESHPDVANSYGDIGSLYVSQGDKKTALEYYRKALQISQAVHGDDHPYTIWVHTAILEITKIN